MEKINRPIKEKLNKLLLALTHFHARIILSHADIYGVTANQPEHRHEEA
jgi:hypothetical protein